MSAPKNHFKSRLSDGHPLIGLWMGLASPYTAEICGAAGFDWLVIDGEHAPNDLQLVLGQLQALAPFSASPVVRVPVGETWMIKQMLDIVSQTILVPMVESADQARELARAMRYPPFGVHGVGAALARASAFSRIGDYLATANDEVCLLVQVESRAGLAAIEEIGEIDGIDGIFIGPADLAADMGHLGNPGADEVQAAVIDAIGRIVASGKAAGLLTSDATFARTSIAAGARFVAVGSDVSVLARHTSALAAAFLP